MISGGSVVPAALLRHNLDYIRNLRAEDAQCVSYARESDGFVRFLTLEKQENDHSYNRYICNV